MDAGRLCFSVAYCIWTEHAFSRIFFPRCGERSGTTLETRMTTVLSLLLSEERTQCGLEDPNNPILRIRYWRDDDGLMMEMLPGNLGGAFFSRLPITQEHIDTLAIGPQHVITLTRHEAVLTVDGVAQQSLDAIGTILVENGQAQSWVDRVAQTLAQLPPAEGLETAVIVALARRLPAIYASGKSELLRPDALRLSVACAHCVEQERAASSMGIIMLSGRRRADIDEVELAYGAHCKMPFSLVAYDIVRMAAEPILRRRERDVFRDFASDLKRTADAVLESSGEASAS